MNTKCLDIGNIQAFLDGELSQAETIRVSAHIGSCDNCALLLADAEEESLVVFPALDREFNTLVPTQRLWNKINDSIRVEQERRPLWTRIQAFLASSFADPSMLAAASLLIVFAVITTVWFGRSTTSSRISDQAAVIVPRVNKTTNIVAAKPVPETSGVGETASTQIEAPIASEKRSAYRIERAAFEPERERPVRGETKERTSEPSFNTAAFLPGEENYVKTIASLSATVNAHKENGLMRPAERIAYERDMAVVNDAIAKMRIEVRRNPKDDSAKQVLYSSYQNKIDLLNSAAQKQELVASLEN